MPPEKTHLCLYENERFPAKEFDQTEEYGLVHNREPRHTARGEVLEGKKPGPVIPGPGRSAGGGGGGIPGPMAPRRLPDA